MHVQFDGTSMGGLNELLPAMLHNENEDTSHQEVEQILHRIEDDATEIYHLKYGSNQMEKIRKTECEIAR
jgi:hypothetical protein